uniref:EXPERA domain-containing protein n=2 Tax=Capra hircus TaxID=9925 RepID=A0A8C2Y072_CAPHI
MGAAGVARAAGRDGAGRGGSRDRSSAALSRRSVPVSVVSAPAQPNRRKMGTLGARRGLEWLLGFYFLSHIPITLLMDLQGVLPRDLYPVELRNLQQWYIEEFKDPLLQNSPVWFKSFLFCELVFQLPFFPIAAYAFFKGGCKWIRIPAIIYSVHTMTTLIPILSTVLLDDFSKASRFRGQGPKTFQERLFLIAVYIPYFLIPLILLLFMVRNPYYKSEEKRKKK